MGKIVGIDLGTTNSCVAVVESGSTTVVQNRDGSRTIPSMVAITEGAPLVGAVAKRQAAAHPQRTIYGVKHLIGRRYDSPEIAALQKVVPHRIVPAGNGEAWVRVEGHDYCPQEISALVLQELKRMAEEHLGTEVQEAIVTVPACFNDGQRKATQEAGAIAGLEVRRIVNEPTAAALGYGVHHLKRDMRIAIFDLGGGTFDITILHLSDGFFEVLSTHGDSFLGGDDWDQRIIDHLLNQRDEATIERILSDPSAVVRLREAAEKAKIELTLEESANINLPFLQQSRAGSLHLEGGGFTRQLFEELTRDLLDRLGEPCVAAMQEADLAPVDIDQVLLVGGMTRVPSVQEQVRRIFGKEPTAGVNPEEIVALGAATQSAIMTGGLDEVVLVDVTPYSLGVKLEDESMRVLIPKNSPIPMSAQKVFATTRDNQDFVMIEVYQGESEHAKDNTSLGRFSLSGLPRAPAGIVNVEVTFMIDADGVVNVAAREMRTGKAASVEVRAATGLTQKQLERLKGERGVTSRA
jgi:molecular chaperone DnaK